MNHVVLELKDNMTDEEARKFADDFESMVSRPISEADTPIIIINGERFKYPRWKKWRDRIWNSLPVIMLEAKLRAWLKRLQR